MKKRTPRKKLSKNKEFKDITKPLDFSKIGTLEDPCFGKHHDVKAPECVSCGDSELCLIALSQKAKLKREKLEETITFKDVEKDIPDEENPTIQVPKLIRKYKKKEYSLKKTLRLVLKKFPDSDKAFVTRLYKNKN